MIVLLNINSIDLFKNINYLQQTQIIIQKDYFFSPSIRMSEKSINFDDKKIDKSNFYKNKNIFKIEDIDVNKILVSKKESYVTKNSSKYIIGYNDDDDIIRQYIKLCQMIGYAKYFDSNKNMSFKLSDNKLLKSYRQQNMGKSQQFNKYRI